MFSRGESEEVLEVQMAGNRVEKIQKLIRTETEENSRILEDKNAQLDKQLKGRLQVICCECGAEILLIPDLKAMDFAIKAHVIKHSERGRKVEGTKRSSEKISQMLSQLTLKKVVEVCDSKFSKS